MKKIICYLFHKIKYTGHGFIDRVSGKYVNYYHCDKCKITFMANGKWNLFRCYPDKPIN